MKKGDQVIFGGTLYEVAEIKEFPHGEMVGIYDEPPTKHIDYINEGSLTLKTNSMDKPFKSNSGKSFSTAEEMADDQAYHSAMMYGNCNSYWTNATSETVKETKWNDLTSSKAVTSRVDDLIDVVFFGKNIDLPKK